MPNDEAAVDKRPLHKHGGNVVHRHDAPHVVFEHQHPNTMLRAHKHTMHQPEVTK